MEVQVLSCAQRMKENNDRLAKIIKHRFFTLFTTLFLALLYIYFLYNHITAIRSGEISNITLVFILMETIVIFLLVFRKSPRDKSTKILPWAFAILGSFMPLALKPFDVLVISESFGNIFMVAGGIMASISYLSLNTSYGTSPSLRTIKTSGLYSFIRHPIYSSYFLLYTGYLLLVFSYYNLAVVALLFACLTIRAHFEEEILLTDEKYKTYSKKVKYRIIPFIY